MEPAETIVLITGTSSGVGRALSLGLNDLGYRVVATMRYSTGRNRIARITLEDRGIIVVDIDVNDSDSVQRGVESALAAVGAIDILVNNAGLVMHGPLEATTERDLIALFNTNVLGPHRMIRAVLPHMRQQRSGLVLQISSGAGRIVLPGGGAYSASKWAIEAMGEAIKWELSHFGVDCVNVELGPLATEALGRSLQEPSDHGVSSQYTELGAAKKRDRIRNGQGSGPSEDHPSTVVEPIHRMIQMERGSRPTRIAIHPYADRLEPYNRMLANIESDVFEDRFPEFTSNGF